MNERVYSKSDFSDFCSFCGFALVKSEIAADIQGNLVLFDEKTTGSCQITLCQECKDRLVFNSVAGLNAAIIKRLDIDNSIVSKIDRKRKTVHKKKRRDDDEGGQSAVLPP